MTDMRLARLGVGLIGVVAGLAGAAPASATTLSFPTGINVLGASPVVSSTTSNVTITIAAASTTSNTVTASDGLTVPAGVGPPPECTSFSASAALCGPTSNFFVGLSGGGTLTLDAGTSTFPIVMQPKPTSAVHVTAPSVSGNVLLGSDSGDQLTGGTSDDAIVPGGGADAVNGASGTDTVSYVDAAHTTAVSVAPGATLSVTSPADGTGDTLTDVDVLTLTAHDDTAAVGGFAVTVNGGDGADTLSGAAGSQTLKGEGGNDALTGGPGNDVLDGGPGTDTFSAGDGADDVRSADNVAETVDCGPDADTATADDIDILIGCETAFRAVVDADGDGFGRTQDCNDANAAIRPGAADVPGNGIDEDCSGADSPAAGGGVGGPGGGGVKALPHSPNTVTARWSVSKGFVKVKELTVKRVPVGGKVVVKCSPKSKGCPFSSTTVTSRKGGTVKLTALFKKRKLKTGVVITVLVTGPQNLGRATAYTVGTSKAPKSKTTCRSAAGKTEAC